MGEIAKLTAEIINIVLDKLESVKAAGQNKWQAKCPAHDDQHPSLSIAVGSDRRILLHCHAGCSVTDICRVLEVELKELFPKKSKSPKVRSRIVASYSYADEDGVLLFQVVREKPKRFWQRRPDGRGGWIRSLQGVRRVLYRLPEIVAAEPGTFIFLVEGEKDADHLAQMGLVATTSPMGAGKWRDEYTESLKDRKVAIIPDNDLSGQRHAEHVARRLIDVAAEVKIINLPDLPDKGDVSDWLDAGGTIEELLQLVDKTDAYEPQAENAPAYDLSQYEEIPYLATERGLFRLKGTRDGEVPVQLTNFPAQIVADVVYDDGAETMHSFEIEAVLNGKIQRFTVPASRFAGMGWVTEQMVRTGYTISPILSQRLRPRCNPGLEQEHYAKIRVSPPRLAKNLRPVDVSSC